MTTPPYTPPKAPKASTALIGSVAHPNVVNATSTVPTTVGAALSDPRPHPAGHTGINRAAGDLGQDEGLPKPMANEAGTVPYKIVR